MYEVISLEENPEENNAEKANASFSEDERMAGSLFRILGAVLVIGGSTAIGFRMALQLRRRAETIAALLGMLDRMESVLSYRLTPLPALMGRLAEGSGKLLAAALEQCRDKLRDPERQPFREIWEEAVAWNLDLPLAEEERKNSKNWDGCSAVTILRGSCGRFRTQRPDSNDVSIMQ